MEARHAEVTRLAEARQAEASALRERSVQAAVPPSPASLLVRRQGSVQLAVPSSLVALEPLEVEGEGSPGGVHVEPYKRANQRAAVVRRLPPADQDAIVAIEMIRKLPSEIKTVLLPSTSLLRLLRHLSPHVRDAALPLLKRDLSDETGEVRQLLIESALRCLELPETRHHALKALDNISGEKRHAQPRRGRPSPNPPNSQP